MAPTMAPLPYSDALDALSGIDIDGIDAAATIELAKAYAVLALCDRLETIARVLNGEEA